MIETALELTGREPRLSANTGQKGKRRLSLRTLSSILQTISPDAVSLEAAVAMLQSDDFYVRYSAAELLSKRADRDARLVLQALLEEDSAPRRASAVRHLYYFSWYVSEPLLRQALSDPDLRVRESAVLALCNSRELNAYQLLAESLANEDDDVRMAAAWGLNGSQDPAVIPALEIIMAAQEPAVRIKALEALGATGAAEAIPAVRQALIGDESADVRYAATLSLIELAGESCLAELAEYIDAEPALYRQQLLRGLFHATSYLHIDVAQAENGRRLINSLESALRAPEAEVRLAAVWPLAWMKNGQAATYLTEAYHRENDAPTKAQFLHVITSFNAELGQKLAPT